MTVNFESIEENILRMTGAESIDWMAIIEQLDAATAAAGPGRSDTLAEFLHETLAAQPDPETQPTLAILLRRADHRTDPEFRKQARALCSRLQHGGCDLTGYCGFDDNLPLRECLARLETLLALQPGGYCYNKSWGFGIIRERNDLSGRFVVDFIRKPGHGIGFAYAAQSFKIPSNDHPAALRYHDPAAHTRLLSEIPGELLKNVLRHYGAMNAVVLQETMIAEGLVPETEWKTFWNNARRALKNDPAVIIPSKKSDPLEYIEEPGERFNADWLNKLAGANEPDRIIEAVIERETEGKPELSGEETRVVADRITHVLRSVPPALQLAETLLVIQRLRLQPDREVISAAWSRLRNPACLENISADLPLRRLRELFDVWTVQNSDEAFDALLALAPTASARVVPLAATFLIEHQRETELAERLRPLFQGPSQPTSAWVLHLLRNPDLSERLGLGPRAQLPAYAVSLLETFGSDTRKTREMPAEYLCRAAHVRLFGDAMTTDQRRDLIRRLQMLTMGPKVEIARSVMAAWIKIYPDLASAAAAPKTTDQPEEVHLTSWRSWREKQRQLEKLVKEEIPANAREIGVARSYGDLRENHEYKAAKEHQTILYRRQAELERDLTVVKGTDFAGLPHDRAGLATCVKIRHDHGEEETMVILGEWDNEPDLNILSCRSERAQRLNQSAPGDRIMLPGADGVGQAATVLSVEGLSENVRQWLNEKDEKGG